MKRDNRRSLIIGLGDLLLVLMAYAGAFYIRFGSLASFREKFPPIFLLMLMGSYLIVFYFFDLYSITRKIRNLTLAGKIVLAVGAAAIIASLIKYLFFLFPIGRGILAIANVLVIGLVFAWRKIGFRLLRMMGSPVPVLLVGSGKGVEEIVSLLGKAPQDYKVLGTISGDNSVNLVKSEESPVPSMGSPIILGEILKSRAVKMIVLTEPEKPVSITVESLLHAHRGGTDVVDITELYQRLKYRIPVEYIPNESWFLQTKGFSLVNNHMAGRIKRLFDISIAGIMFVITLPLWPFIAIMIKIESRGPVFYRQNRVGKNESIFRLYKFRSMIENAEDDKPVWAKENDRRVTRIGRIMRKAHIDELPQLGNVLKGDMSLVGPRPERPEFVANLKKEVPYYALRHFVKPGLTGWAQINYRYAASTEDSKAKLEYDLYYVSRMNVIFDLKIIVETLAGILFRRREE